MRSGSGKEGAAAASLLPERVTFASQAGMCSRCRAPLLHWQQGETEQGCAHASFPVAAKGKETLEGPSSSLLPDLFSSTLTHAANDLLFHGVPRAEWQSQTGVPCLICCLWAPRWWDVPLEQGMWIRGVCWDGRGCSCILAGVFAVLLLILTPTSAL